MARVVVPLAAGFEEIEAVSIIDVLRRADVAVTVASLDAAAAVEGAHGITVQADTRLDALQPDDFDMIVLPGGEPGTTHLAADAGVQTWLRHFADRQAPIAAICAAPRVLGALGMLDQRAATSHPSVEDQLRQSGADYRQERVVCSDRIVTSRGPGTALEFALEVLQVLGKHDEAAQLRRAMLVHD